MDEALDHEVGDLTHQIDEERSEYSTNILTALKFVVVMIVFLVVALVKFDPRKQIHPLNSPEDKIGHRGLQTVATGNKLPVVLYMLRISSIAFRTNR